jgi:hypothetical protein
MPLLPPLQLLLLLLVAPLAAAVGGCSALLRRRGLTVCRRSSGEERAQVRHFDSEATARLHLQQLQVIAPRTQQSRHGE